MAHNACFNASYDFNLLREGLRRQGYQLVQKPEDADEVIFAGCAVRGKWVDDAIRQITSIHDRAPKAKVTVTGCVASIDAEMVRSLTRVHNLTIGRQEDVLKRYTGLEIGTLDRDVTQDTSIDFEGATDNGLSQLRRRLGPEKAEVVASLQQVDREHGTVLESTYRRTTRGFVFYHENEPTEFIVVTRSCPYKCAFCAIPHGRGAYTSVPLDAVLEKARTSLARGIRRITLIGDEVGNYGANEKGPKFRDLMTALLDLDPGIRLSIRYLEPKPFLRNADLFRRWCGDGRIDLLYVSLQSGSQRILDAMSRRYNIGEIANFYSTLRRTTDTVFYCNWMVGFPSETHSEYMETVSLVKDLNLQINTAVPFSARPNTPANDMTGQIDEQEKELRVDGLKRVIADIKVASFAGLFDVLEPARRASLVQKIGNAELVEHDNLMPGPA
ncbi:hypothetical protein SCD_n00241 [Sulfuricella denitrificans skB26]|uniref:Uncharacterized protein n=1 Tax=Sulfuricella denitrificans (strain DSM 22764 / NBRC 105220 / skB26) TaxID=1163617 RepID=S6A9G9_SULDS|nr:radical SAM protein [Sulfuricella denitrificans]BAN34090.1 hypothetical protein SCD_n00241 [Sulfuricella denitrificans skB26]